MNSENVNHHVMKNKWITELVSALLLLLFLYAGLSKMMVYRTFVFEVGESPFKLLAKSAHWIGWFIPVTELLIASLLPFIKTRLLAFYGSFILMLVFTIYIGAMLLSGFPLPCACGGIISELHWPGHLALNVFFLIISIIGLRIERNNRSKKMQHVYSMR